MTDEQLLNKSKSVTFPNIQMPQTKREFIQPPSGNLVTGFWLLPFDFIKWKYSIEIIDDDLAVNRISD